MLECCTKNIACFFLTFSLVIYDLAFILTITYIWKFHFISKTILTVGSVRSRGIRRRRVRRRRVGPRVGDAVGCDVGVGVGAVVGQGHGGEGGAQKSLEST